MLPAVAEAFALATAFLWCAHQRVQAPTIQPDSALVIGAADQALNDERLGSPAALLAVLRARLPQ
eukprot:2768548-Lingulodinium_polyedra.AAC.1